MSVLRYVAILIFIAGGSFLLALMASSSLAREWSRDDMRLATAAEARMKSGGIMLAAEDQVTTGSNIHIISTSSSGGTTPVGDNFKRSADGLTTRAPQEPTSPPPTVPESLARTALVTVITHRWFIPGAFGLAKTFLRHNPNFKGDMICLYSDIAPSSDTPKNQPEQDVEPSEIKMLRGLGFKMKPFVQIPVEYAISEKYNTGGKYKHTFDKIRAFDEKEYDVVIYMDADVVVKKDLSPWFAKPVEEGQLWARMGHPLFNSGVMVFNPKMVNVAELTSLMARGGPSDIRSDFGDQELFKDFFAHRWHNLKGVCCNICAGDVEPPDECRVMHFNGEPKPWAPGKGKRSYYKAYM